MRENHLCLSIPSYCSQVPSHEYVEALEPSELICISHDKIEELFRKHKEFNVAGRVLTGKIFADVARKSRDMRMAETYERIEALRKREPELVKRVPEKYLRTYMAEVE